ncbi:chaperone protein dnaJ 20, chloroplastic-like [Triticum dicoccoides]|uniref:chaperone protein dnaJ 20, chloroplastic-like n=1 Tax=Triticum dicoccoides TaxID=85692 RepID=UPI001890FE23|nr:chaperone protein dnaJ 20, chloroplastic-like [Triticum dicoccoides]
MSFMLTLISWELWKERSVRVFCNTTSPFTFLAHNINEKIILRRRLWPEERPLQLQGEGGGGRERGVRSPSRGDYYKVLSLEHSADVGAEEVKRAYRRLALQYHPDVCPPSRRAESTELFVELQRAYETLSDPATRVQYDAQLTGRASTRPDGFARDVWEAQLSVLRERSERRQNGRRCSGRRF